MIWKVNVEVDFVDGQGTTTELTTYSYTSQRLETGMHRFRLRQVDVDGTESVSETVAVRVLPEETVNVIVRSSLSANPKATITPIEDGDPQVEFYDILGRKVDVLHRGTVQSGQNVHVDLSSPYFCVEV